MKSDNKITVGQLVRIKSNPTGDAPDKLYLVVGKNGKNCELLATDERKNKTIRRWWTESGLEVYE